jgi:hypothetical protein
MWCNVWYHCLRYSKLKKSQCTYCLVLFASALHSAWHIIQLTNAYYNYCEWPGGLSKYCFNLYGLGDWKWTAISSSVNISAIVQAESKQSTNPSVSGLRLPKCAVTWSQSPQGSHSNNRHRLVSQKASIVINNCVKVEVKVKLSH